MKNIVLIGIMGCGKTTVSKLLSEKLNMPVIDCDEYLVEKYHQTIVEMFDISEEYFRDKETEVCYELSKLDNHIISTGGGVILKDENIQALKSNGIIIYLDRPIDNILTDVETSTRPLLKDGPDKLYQLHQIRHPLYMKACDYHIINDETLEDVLDEIIKQLK